MATMNAVQLLEKWVDTFNRGDVDGAQKLYTLNATLEEIGTGRKLMKEEIPASFQGWRTAFPNASGKAVNVISSRNQAVGEIVWSGTHKGEFMGKPATNHDVTVRAVVILFAEAGFIRYVRHYIDIAGLMKQLEAPAASA